MQGVCQNGDCLNTLGSFKCSCKAGLVLDRNRCVGGYPGFHLIVITFSFQNGILIPKWNPLVSSVRFRISSWARPVLPDRVRVQGLRACAAHPYHPGHVLLHGGQSLGTQLWKMSTGGHRWVDGDGEERLQAEKKDIKLSWRHPCVCPLVKTLWWSNLDLF